MADEFDESTGLRRAIKALIALLLVAVVALTFWFGREPGLFDVRAAAQQRAASHKQKMVTGYVTTNTLIKIAGTLLDKPGGYLSNDKLPPMVFMDNMPSWEFGALIQVRDFAKALRNDISRGQTQSIESPDLAAAEPKFNVDNHAWLFPAAESEYRDGIHSLERYLDGLVDQESANTQFYSRADNLRDWLKTVASRLGGLSQRLSASVGQERINTDLAGEPDAKLSTKVSEQARIKTSWLDIDNVFYESRGTCWALIHLLRAIEIDFRQVLEKKNATRSLQQIIRELEATQRTVWSPYVLNGSGFGLFANYSLVMSSYVSRANSGVIDLRDLLSKG